MHHKQKTLAVLGLFAVLLATKPTVIKGQFEGILDAVKPLIPGVKNVIGGILGADTVHNNCLQKAIM